MHSPRFIPRTKTLFPAGFNLPQRRNLPKLCYGSGLSGMHSDIGGGYPPGDQGKAVGHNDSNLLSQIALHDMYASAFEAGAPLKVSPQSLPKELLSQLWRAMPPELQLEFTISESLVERFNAGVSLLLIYLQIVLKLLLMHSNITPFVQVKMSLQL